METDTHIQYTVKWRKDQYPLMTEEYKRLKNQKNGILLHKICAVFEAYLEKQQGKERLTVESSKLRQIFREEIKKLKTIPNKDTKDPQKDTTRLQKQEQEELGQILDNI